MSERYKTVHGACDRRIARLEARITELRKALANWHADGSFYVDPDETPHPKWCWDNDLDRHVEPWECICGTDLLGGSTS